MQLKNTPTQYGAVTKALHWTIAAIVIFQLIIGSWMGSLPMGVFKLDVVLLHKSLGITVLFLIVTRLLWHLFSRRPAPLETLTRFERIASRALHDSFYLLLLVMPLSGWALSSAHGAPVHFFGLFTLPDFVAENKASAHFYREVHGYVSDVLIAVICLHVAAALMHHFYTKDNVLKRMLPALFCLALLGGQAPAANAQAAKPNAAAPQNWSMLHEKSTITFTPTQLGKAFTGKFGVFAADIVFSPDDLAASHVMIDVHMNTAATGAPDRDQNLMGEDWFDVAKFPDAVFKSSGFRKVGADAYIADGVLTIKGVTVPATLPFKLNITTNANGTQTAVADGSVVLDRAKFNVGVGQWKSTDIIANEVPVTFHIVALGAAARK
ncbi:MAG: YceI family protein [Alphaproteobacteria bacterium]|nr:YceI family protein [Alphaproteobacteria bacterium]